MPPPTAPAPVRSQTVALIGRAGVPVEAKVMEIGNGRPIVFLHGLVGQNEHWEEVAKRLSHPARCIMLELPLLNLEGEDCSIHGATDLAAVFLREHVQEPATIVGNSFGGHVALKLAIEQPHLVRALVLTGASGLIEKSIVSDVQIRPSMVSDVSRAHEVLSRRPQARAMVKLSKSARRNHLGDELHRISCPTLILWGRQDIVTPPEACEQFRRDISDSRVVWIEECGHAPMIECPGPFAEALGVFLSQLP